LKLYDNRSGDGMGKLLELKEFETIIANPDYENQYKCMDRDSFVNLIELIHTFDCENTESDILDFIKIGYRRNIGETVTFKNYVGLIQMKNNYQIQILPKIEFLDNEKDETKQIFMKMLRSMKDFPSKVFTNTNLKIDRMNLYEIFINMYLQEVRKLVKRGIKSSYVSQEENLNVYKGKLIVNEHIKSNFVHKERFYVGFEDYQVNRPENRIVKSTLLKLQKISNSAENTKEISQLLISFECVENSENYDSDFSKIIIDRNTKDYEMLMKWSKVFLKNKSFTTFSGDNNARALLFPMEKVFESYVAKNLRKVFWRAGFNVSTQDRGHYLFNKLNGERHRKFALRPDIVVTRDDGSTVILDTKWKRLVNDKGINYGISQTDMYQMYAYAKKYNTADIWVLYPKNRAMRDCDKISFDSGDGVTVSVFFVDLANIERSMGELLNVLK
jgi:hypothetical protein